MTRTTLVLAVALVLGAAGLLAVAPTASADGPYCEGKLYDTNCLSEGQGFCHIWIAATNDCLVWT